MAKSANTKATDVAKKLTALFPPDAGNAGVDFASFRRSAHAFERFVLELLRMSSQDSDGRSAVEFGGRIFDDSGRVAYRPDAVAKHEIAGLKPPVYVEVLATAPGRSRGTLKMRIDALVGRCVGAGVQSLLVVTNVRERDRGLSATYLKKIQGSLAIRVWGPDDLQGLVESGGSRAQLLLDNIPVASVATAVTASSQGRTNQWRFDRIGLLRSLQAAWRRDDLALFLGAGVSIEAGVPSWNQLLGGLFGALVDRLDSSLSTDDLTKSTSARRLVALQSGSPLMTARYIRSGLQDTFVPTLRDELYRDEKEVPTPQLNAIARICDPPRGRSGVKAVITYNFDDLLERHLAQLHIHHTTISRPGQRAHTSHLPVYHVHGFVPKNGDLADADADLLVFSEEGYHNAYNDPYHWSNIVQLNMLTEATCVFIGLSMTDPNLRRLLEIANRTNDRARHVAFLRRTKATTGMSSCPMSDENCDRHTPDIDARVESTILSAHHGIWEQSLGELGVQIAWFEDFVEIPTLIEAIVQSDQESD